MLLALIVCRGSNVRPNDHDTAVLILVGLDRSFFYQGSATGFLLYQSISFRVHIFSLSYMYSVFCTFSYLSYSKTRNKQNIFILIFFSISQTVLYDLIIEQEIPLKR